MTGAPQFTRAPGSALFYLDVTAVDTGGAPYAVGFVPFHPLPPGQLTVDFGDSWNATPGRYVFLGGRPADEAAFLAGYTELLAYPGWTAARFLWLANPDDAPQYWQVSAIAVPGGATATSAPAVLALRNYALTLPARSAVTVDAGGTVAFAGAAALTAGFGQASFPVADATVTLRFTGGSLGCLTFDTTLAGGTATPTALDTLDAGCRVFADHPALPGLLVSYRYPVVDLGATKGDVTLACALDPVLPLAARRSRLAVRGGALASYYRTTLGGPVTLTPTGTSALVFAVRATGKAVSAADPLYLTPDGSFTATWVAPPERADVSPFDQPVGPQLMCGLSAVEYVGLPTTGSAEVTLTFAAGRPAYTAMTPPATPRDRPAYAPLATIGSTGLPLTSWAYVSAPAALTYFAQPQGATLFRPRAGDTNATTDDFLATLNVPAGALPPLPGSGPLADAFPLLPYAGMLAGDAATIGAIEAQAVSTTRRRVIAAIDVTGQRPHPLPVPHLAEGAPDDQDVTGATPGGLTAVFDSTLTTWKSLTIATSGSDHLVLSGVTGQLKAALQSNQLFLVVTSSAKLASYCSISSGTLSIAGYTFSILADTAGWLRPGTTLVFKFMKKKLVDLVKDTSSWFAPGDFNDDVKATQQALTALVQQAATSLPTTPDLAGFVALANDESWNGVLVLGASITVLPDQIESLMAGIDRDAFLAHHIGVNVSPVTVSGGQVHGGDSSLFGFVSYTDPEPMVYNGTPYQFRVVMLRALFQNSALANFSSTVGLWTNDFFGERATLRDSTNGNQIDLYGVYQDHNGAGSYLFTSRDDYVFDIASQVVQRVEVSKAQLVTVSVTTENDGSQLVVSRFLLWGSLSFHALAAGSTTFDVFSFGDDYPLRYSNLYVEMTAHEPPPSDGDEPTTTTYALVSNAAVFDLAGSAPRPGSLYDHFPLTLTGMTSGTGSASPTASGYLPVDTPLTGDGVADTWFGLRFSLDLGSAGALAAKGGFVASLLAAWSPAASGQRVFTGLQLPGSEGAKKDISIQGVVKITFGKLVFLVGDDGGYVLKLQNIALSLLGKSLPSAGQVSLLLFGDPSRSKSRSLGWYGVYAEKPPAKPSGKPLAPVRPAR